MIWRSDDRILARLGDELVLFDPSGRVLRRFFDRSYSDEDDLWQFAHVVLGDTLVERAIVEHNGPASAKVTREEKILAGLRESDDDATRRFVETSLAREAEAKEKNADDRVARIAGALEAYGLGVDFDRAQASLVRRVRAYGDALDESLLRTLVALARDRPEPAIATAYARGCLLACFERSVPELVDATPRHLRIASELAARARDLHDASDGQERVDANANATAYFKAARAVEHAAKLAGWSGT